MIKSKKITIVAYNLRYGGGVFVGEILINNILNYFSNHKILLIVNHAFCTSSIDRKDDKIEYRFVPNLKTHVDKIYYQLFKIIRVIKKYDSDLVINLGNFPIPFLKIPQVLLIQNAFYCTRTFDFFKYIPIRDSIILYFQKIYIKIFLNQISLIICQTSCMADKFRDYYKYNKIIYTLPNPVGISKNTDKYQTDCNFLIFLQKKIQNRKVLFYPSAYYPHKNFNAIFNLLNKYSRDLNEYLIVLTIDVNNQNLPKKLSEKIRKYSSKNSLLNLGRISQDQLSLVYKRSYAMFMPSLLESFSSTFTEAMSHGVPVLASKNDFSIEICSNSAIYFDPYSVDDIFNKIGLISIKRNTLISMGKARVNFYQNEFLNKRDMLFKKINSFLI